MFKLTQKAWFKWKDILLLITLVLEAESPSYDGYNYALAVGSDGSIYTGGNIAQTIKKYWEPYQWVDGR